MPLKKQFFTDHNWQKSSFSQKKRMRIQ